jgi:hypothetical protein
VRTNVIVSPTAFSHQAGGAQQIIIEILFDHRDIGRRKTDRLGADRCRNVGERLAAAARRQIELTHILHQGEIVGVDGNRKVTLRGRPQRRRRRLGGGLRQCRR